MTSLNLNISNPEWYNWMSLGRTRPDCFNMISISLVPWQNCFVSKMMWNMVLQKMQSQKWSDIYMETNLLQGRMQKQGIWILITESWRNTYFWFKINIWYHWSDKSWKDRMQLLTRFSIFISGLEGGIHSSPPQIKTYLMIVMFQLAHIIKKY